jgi:hypothetical protein
MMPQRLLGRMLGLSQSGTWRAIKRGDPKVLALQLAWEIMLDQERAVWLDALGIQKIEDSEFSAALKRLAQQ